jgi:hypothetical protein
MPKKMKLILWDEVNDGVRENKTRCELKTLCLVMKRSKKVTIQNWIGLMRFAVKTCEVDRCKVWKVEIGMFSVVLTGGTTARVARGTR